MDLGFEIGIAQQTDIAVFLDIVLVHVAVVAHLEIVESHLAVGGAHFQQAQPLHIAQERLVRSDPGRRERRNERVTVAAGENVGSRQSERRADHIAVVVGIRKVQARVVVVVRESHGRVIGIHVIQLLVGEIRIEMSLRSVFAERAFVVQLGDVADSILEHAGGPARQIGVQIGTQLHEIPFRIVVIIAAEILRHVVITIVARLEGQFARDAQSARDEVEIDRNAGIRRGVHTRIFGVSRTVQDAVCRHGEGLHRRHATVLGRGADHRRGLLENRTVNTFVGIAVPGQAVVAHIARNTGKGADVLGDVHVDLRTEVHPKAARSGRVFVGLLLQERSLVHEVDVRPDARALDCRR